MWAKTDRTFVTRQDIFNVHLLMEIFFYFSSNVYFLLSAFLFIYSSCITTFQNLFHPLIISSTRYICVAEWLECSLSDYEILDSNLTFVALSGRPFPDLIDFGEDSSVQQMPENHVSRVDPTIA